MYYCATASAFAEMINIGAPACGDASSPPYEYNMLDFHAPNPSCHLFLWILRLSRPFS